MVSRPVTTNLISTLKAEPRSRDGSRYRPFDNLAAVIMPAARTHVVRTLQLAAIRAFCVRSANQRIVRTPHITPRFGRLFLRNSHVSKLVDKGSRLKATAYVAVKRPAGKHSA
jgi:hypothetical protein